MIISKIQHLLLFTGLFTFTIGMFSPSSLEAMAHKGQEELKAQGDRKVAFDRRRAANRAPAMQPSFAGRLHALAAAGSGKGSIDQQQSHNPRRPLCANPPHSDVPCIPLLNWAIDDSLKVKVFKDIAQRADRETEALYRLAHDPIIKKYLHDAKTFYEYNSLKDACGKTMLDHAIAQDDAAFVGPLVGNLTTDERHKLIRNAATQKKLRALLALVPKIDGKTDELALLDYFKNIQDLTAAETEGYQKALLLAKKHRGIRDEYTKKIIQQIIGKKHNPFSQLPQEIGLEIQEMINMTGDGGKMHPELEDTLKKIDFAKIDRLLGQGCDLLAYNTEGKKDLEGVDPLWRLSLLIRLPNTIPLKGLPHRIRFKEAAKSAMGSEDLSKEARESRQRVINSLEEVFTGRDNILITAVNNNNTAIALELLSSSWAADPNCKLDNGDPLLWLAVRRGNNVMVKLLLSFGSNPNAYFRPPASDPLPVLFDTLFIDDTEKMKLLLDHGANPNTFVRARDTREVHSMFYWAMIKNKPAHAQLLLDHGADAWASMSGGDPFTFEALDYDPIFLEMLLKHNADPNATKKAADDGKEYSLLYWAIRNNKPRHVALLCKWGARVDALDQNGDPLMFVAAREEDSACLEALINHGINVNAINKKNKSLLMETIGANRPKNFRVLLQHGANPNLELPDTSPLEPGDIIFVDAAGHRNPEFLKILLAHKGKHAIKKSSAGYHGSLLIASLLGQSNTLVTVLEHEAGQERQAAAQKKKGREDGSSCTLQ